MLKINASITFKTSGIKNAPINAIAKIRTGNSAKFKLPNIVECIRHSSLNIALKIVNIKPQLRSTSSIKKSSRCVPPSFNDAVLPV